MLIKELIKALAEIPTVSGFEDKGADMLTALIENEIGDNFDVIKEKCGIRLFPRNAHRADVKLLIDAHIDTVGFVVTGIDDEGFLTVTPVGGTDNSVMCASELVVYGREIYNGVVVSVPPHLSKLSGDNSHNTGEDKLSVDVGMSYMEASENIPIGSVCTYSSPFIELSDNMIASKYLDNKISAAVAIQFLKQEKECALQTEVFLSYGEESSMRGASAIAANNSVSAVLVLDANFGDFPGNEKSICFVNGKGVVISKSAVTDKRLTALLETSAKENGIPYSAAPETLSTGTNANVFNYSSGGLPSAVLSIPVGNMHSLYETASVDDAHFAVKLLKSFVLSFAGHKDLFEDKVLKGERMF